MLVGSGRPCLRTQPAARNGIRTAHGRSVMDLVNRRVSVSMVGADAVLTLFCTAVKYSNGREAGRIITEVGGLVTRPESALPRVHRLVPVATDQVVAAQTPSGKGT